MSKRLATMKPFLAWAIVDPHDSRRIIDRMENVFAVRLTADRVRRNGIHNGELCEASRIARVRITEVKP